MTTRTSSITLKPTREQFNALHNRLRNAGWVKSHSIMDDSQGQHGLQFGTCYLKDGIAMYVNYLTFELINLTLDATN